MYITAAFNMAWMNLYTVKGKKKSADTFAYGIYIAATRASNLLRIYISHPQPPHKGTYREKMASKIK